MECMIEEKPTTVVAKKQQVRDIDQKKRKSILKSSSKKSSRSVDVDDDDDDDGDESTGRSVVAAYGKLVCYEELPEYMKENEYIRGYYRSEWPLSHAFFSIFSWHNETINIWTHLVGFFVFLGFTMVHLGHVPQVSGLLGHFNFPWSISLSAVENASCNQANILNVVATPFISLLRNNSSATAARWPFFVFLAGSMFCLLVSSLCHLLCCHSRPLNLLLARLDYAGIAVMIVTSFFPPIYYIFQCDPLYQIVYLAAISVFGLLTVMTMLSPELSKGKFRSYRAMVFVAMALFGIVPAVHATVVNWSEPRRNVTLAYEGLMAAAYLTGTAFYVSRVPERWCPGAFDLTGHSHQIFHVFVMCGALAHYGAALVFLEYRDAVGCSS